MQARARVLSVFNHAKPDRVPIFEHLRHVRLIESVTGRSLASSPYEITAEAYKRLGVDMCALLWAPREGVSESDGMFSEKGFRTRHDGYEHWIVERPFSSVEEAATWRPRYSLPLLEEETAGVVERQQRLVGDSTMIIGRSRGFLLSSYMNLGWEIFATLMYEYPDALAEIMDIYTERCIQIAHILARETSTPAFLYVADIAGNDGPLFSPRWLDAHYFSRLRRVIRVFKDHGIRFIYHCDGNIMPLVDRLLDAGVDAFHPLDPMGNMSLRTMRAQYGNELVLFGNANINYPEWSVDDVEREVQRCIEEGGSEGNYFLSNAVGISGLDPDVPLDNIIAFFKAVERVGRY